MKQSKKLEVTIWVLTALPLVALAAMWALLPQQIPVHWNLQGVADGYDSKWGMAQMLVVIAGVQLLLKYLPRLDPRRAKYKRFGTGYQTLRLAFAIFVASMQGVVLCETMRPGRVNISSVTIIGIGALFCVIGSFLPKCKHNYFVGIRTPWTLASERVWYRTHNMAGHIWQAGGVVIVLCALFLRAGALFTALLCVVAVCVAVPVVRSYCLFRYEKGRGAV